MVFLLGQGAQPPAICPSREQMAILLLGNQYSHFLFHGTSLFQARNQLISQPARHEG